MRTGLIFFIVLLQQVLLAQIADSVKVVGQILPESGAKFKPDNADLRLLPYKEGEIASINQVNPDGGFTLVVKVKYPSLYELRYKDYKMSFFLSPAEPVCKVIIKTDEKQEVKSMKVTESRENDAYRIFKRENKAFEDMLRNLKEDCAGNDKSCVAKYKKNLASQNELMEYLKNGYKGTFTAAVLANIGEVPEITGTSSVLAQLQSGFFDATNFLDTAIYRTPDFSNKISWYLDYVADTNAAARVSFINGLMGKAKGKREAGKLFRTLLNNFLDDYREPYIKSLVEWVNSNPSFKDDYPVFAAKIKLIAGVLPGMPAPDVTGENLDRQAQTLLATTNANRLTLLIFWESDCPHCRKAMPDFIRIYKDYRARGLEVFAASLDNDKAKWKQFIDINHLTWTNIVLPEKSSAHADYFIQYTPTVVLIDNKGKILRRFIGVEDLEKTISHILDK